MQLKLNLTDTADANYRDYCDKNNLTTSQGISNLLLKVQGQSDLLDIKDQHIKDLRTLVNLYQQNSTS